MSRYKVRNCPCFDNRIWQEPTCNITPCDCQTCTDCLIKRVIEECRCTLNMNNIYCGEQPYAMGRCIEAERILNMFEIQEVEE